MQFGTLLSWVSLWNLLCEDVHAATGTVTSVVSGRLKSIVSIVFWGLDERVSCAKEQVDRS